VSVENRVSEVTLGLRPVRTPSLSQRIAVATLGFRPAIFSVVSITLGGISRVLRIFRAVSYENDSPRERGYQSPERLR
jgi:hypothetical protein